MGWGAALLGGVRAVKIGWNQACHLPACLCSFACRTFYRVWAFLILEFHLMAVLLWGWKDGKLNWYALCSVSLDHALLSLLEQVAGAWTQRSPGEPVGHRQWLHAAMAVAVTLGKGARAVGQGCVWWGRQRRAGQCSAGHARGCLAVPGRMALMCLPILPAHPLCLPAERGVKVLGRPFWNRYSRGIIDWLAINVVLYLALAAQVRLRLGGRAGRVAGWLVG